MKSALFKITSTVAALALCASAVAAGTGGCRGSDFECFKRRMMPKVGRKVTVVGVLGSAKLGWAVKTGGGVVYIYAVRDTDAPKMKALNGHTVKATGVLHYSPGSTPARTEVAEASVPEHFIFEVAEVEAVAVGRARHRHLKRERGA
jgi:hypothetical protein